MAIGLVFHDNHNTILTANLPVEVKLDYHRFDQIEASPDNSHVYAELGGITVK